MTDTTTAQAVQYFMGMVTAESPAAPIIGDLVEGTVVNIERGRLYIDVPPFGTAIIYGKEYLSARDVLKNVNVGDSISAKVVATENEDGYIEVSLREARQALVWGEAEAARDAKTVLELAITEANKGGLIVEWQGVSGFLPASQLSAEHYPRVPDGDKDKIFMKLKELIGTKIPMMIITADAKEQKLIFSGKVGETEDRAHAVSQFAVGDVMEGTVTGATDFGVFVKIDDSLEGLVHISEMDWALVENPKTRYKVGDKVKVKIIDIKDGKISLSIKALTEDPWKVASAKYEKGQKVDAVIIKFNKHGALASIEEGVAGLVHVSEFGSEDKLREALSLGSVHSFSITLFDPKEHRMTLSYKSE
jgi:small subunit ribosomal protein S1